MEAGVGFIVVEFIEEADVGQLSVGSQFLGVDAKGIIVFELQRVSEEVTKCEVDS
jgi:hypothetical protein